MSQPRSSAAPSLALTDALGRSAPLALLLERVQASNARYAAARAALPAALADLVRPGPLDDAGWTLLVPGGAAAAKLRQCLPHVQARLKSQGFPELTIRVKVQVSSR
jgi:hypothetical protein